MEPRDPPDAAPRPPPIPTFDPPPAADPLRAAESIAALGAASTVALPRAPARLDPPRRDRPDPPRLDAARADVVVPIRLDTGELVSLPDPPIAAPVPGAARGALFFAQVVFVAGVLAPALLLAWLCAALMIVAIAGVAIVHTGGLEPRTFGTSLAIGAGLAAVAFVSAWRPRRDPDPEDSLALVRPGTRHPLWRRAFVLVAAAAVCVAAALPRSPYFPYPLATMIVVGGAGFLCLAALYTAFWLTRLAWRASYRWGTVASYRAGFLTAALLLVGGAGLYAQYRGAATYPLDRLRTHAALDDVDEPTGPVDASARTLCLAAAELDPALARADVAPLCTFVPR